MLAEKVRKKAVALSQRGAVAKEKAHNRRTDSVCSACLALCRMFLLAQHFWWFRADGDGIARRRALAARAQAAAQAAAVAAASRQSQVLRCWVPNIH